MTRPDIMFSATPCARVAAHADGRVLVHAGAVVARRGPRSRRRCRASSPQAMLCAPDGFTIRQRRGPWRRRRGRAAAGSGRAASVGARSTTSAAAVDRGHQTRTPPRCRRGRRRLPDAGVVSAPGSTAIARNSDAIATQSSVSAITAGLQAIGSRRTAKPSAVPIEERVEAVEVVEAVHQRVVERVALAQPPRQVAGGHLGVVLGVELDALAAQLAAEVVVVRERAVVDEAEVEAGRERVRAHRS